MTLTELFIFLLKFYIPAAWSILFRAVAFGYSSKRRVVLGFLVYTLYVLGIPALLMILMGYGAYTHISSVVMTIGSMAVLIFTTDPPGKTIFLQLTQGAMCTVMSVILNMVRTVFSLSYPMLLVMLAICSPILFFVALRWWAKPMRFLIDNVQEKIGSLLVLPVLTLVIVNLIPVYPPQSFANYPIYCTMMMLAVECAFFLYIYTLYRSLRRISVLSRQNTQTELLKQEIYSYQSYLETARQSRHDLRHHDALLLERLENGDTEGAIQYLREHGAALASTTLTRFCSEPTINAVLRIYERRAQGANISFSAVCDLPNQVPLDAPELGGILGNLLENALDAAGNVDGDAFITLSAKVEDGSLLIEVCNTKKGERVFVDDMPISAKIDGGTGTKSVRSIVERHNGIVIYSQREDRFYARVILPLFPPT